jgi:hypothetical protein
MMRKFLSAIIICLFAASAYAQTTGRLAGTISGPDGVLPGAQIVVRDNQTGREITIQAKDDGSFVIPQLEFGTYTVTITAQGFKTFTTTDLKIDAGREYTLNPTLEVGGVTETVTVSAGADILNSANAELSSTVSPRQVIDLPINGRNPLALISLQPGANATSDSINGQRSSTTNYTRDGINIQDQFIRTGGFVQDLPTVDDTGEFTVTTQNAGAEQGGGGSSQIQLVTPRGGQRLSGAAFIFNRNSEFSANNFFNNASIDPLTGRGIARPFLNRNQIGGKIGGPLPFPNFGDGGAAIVKDKAFFFASYEKLFLRQQAGVTRNILLGAARNGTFTYRAAGRVNPATGQVEPVDGIPVGTPITINVLTGQGLNLGSTANQTLFNTAGGVLPVDPVVQSRLLSRIPTVGNLAVGNGGLTQQLRFNTRDNRDRDSFVTRFDYDLNDRNSLNFVYRFVRDIDDRFDFDTGGFDPTPFSKTTGNVHLFTGAYRTFIGSNFTNEFRFGYTQANPFFTQGPLNTDFLIEDATLPFDISNPEPTANQQGRNTRQITFRDDASYSFGNHSFRFGGQLELQKIVSLNDAGIIPTYFFTTTANTRTPRLSTALFPGGINATERTRADTLRYFLGGVIGAGTVIANPTSSTSGPILGQPSIEDLRYETIGLYVSDQWRVLPSLTLNFGLRYDVFTPLRSKDKIYLEPVIPNGVDPVAAILNPVGTFNIVGTNIGKPGEFFRADKNNFGPQFSFAWSPQFKNNLLGALFGEGRTTIRGGYRMSYVNDEYLKGALNAARGNDGLVVEVNAVDTLANGNTTINLNRRLRNITGGGFPNPTALPIPFTFAQGNEANGAFFNTIFLTDPKLQVPRTHEYNVGIQREIGFNMAIEARYVGGRSNSLIRGLDFNQVDIRRNGFLDDFLIAQRNLAISRVANATNSAIPISGAFNPNLQAQGSRPTPVFNRLPFGAFLDNSAVISQLDAGTPADLAVLYIQNGLDVDENGVGVPFRRNFNAGPVDLLVNNGKFRYNALQLEIRRRFVQGFSFQANYTFQKTLTNVPEQDQNRFDPLLDNENPNLEWSRSDFDRAHAFNFNAIYELPFGKGKAFLDRGGLTDLLFGGYQISAIVQAVSGQPISIRDVRGTLNRSSGGRSNRQTAFSNLTKQQIKDLIGIYRTPQGIFFINPSVIAPDGTATGGNVNATPNNPAFQGQVFFNNAPGQTGNLERAFLSGPTFFTVDVGLSKRIRFSERTSLQLRAEAFNLLNRANFLIGTGLGDGSAGENSNIFNINSTTFGRIQTAFPPRILQFGARFEF